MIKWMLPVCDSDSAKEPYIRHNAKYHCYIGGGPPFVTIGRSLCGRHMQDMDYDSEIREEDIFPENHILCKKCTEKYFDLSSPERKR